MPLRTTWRLAALLLLAFVLVAQDADAQRRRRRRRRPPPEPTETAAPAETEEEGDGPPSSEGAPTEESAEAEPPEPDAEPSADEGESFAALPDLTPIRSEFEALMDELVQTRSRIAILGRQLFDTRIEVRIVDRSGDEQILESLDLRLDGAPIFDAERELESVGSGRRVFEGFAAPGPHVLTVSTELRAREDEEYRAAQNDTFRFMVVRGALTEVRVTLDDDSDIAEDFAEDGEGEFDLRVRVRVATRELDDAEEE